MNTNAFRYKTALCAVLLTMVLAGVSDNARSASWLDKLKEKLDGEETGQVLSTGEIAEGLREALRVGTENTVDYLGKTDGFNLDPDVHIPLPGALETAGDLLAKIGMGSIVDDLEVRLNRAAEIATPKARALFIEAINQMTLEDIMEIYQGPDDAATQYFRSKMSAPLAQEMRPVIEDSLSDAGAVNVYDDFMEQYNALPFVPRVEADLTDHVLNKGMDGIFHYVAKEEAAIRRDPVKRTTDLLKRVFGN